MNPSNLIQGIIPDERQKYHDDGGAVFEIPAQLGFLYKPKRFKGAKGGRGSAKSTGFCLGLLLVGIQGPKKILCGREIQDSITESVYALLVELIITRGLDDQSKYGAAAYKFNKTEIWNDLGTRFLFSGIRYNITKIKSMQGIDICFIDEADKISKESWDVLIPTIRKEGSEIWFCYNPNSKFDETHVRFATRNDEDCTVVTINHRDNPWFPDVLRREMEDCRKTRFKDYLHIWEGLTKEETGEVTFQMSWLTTWQNPNVGGNAYILVDPANSKTKKSDFTVICVLIATKDGNFLCREIVRDRMEMEKFEKLFEMVGRYRRMGYNVTVGYERYGMQMDKQYIEQRQKELNFFFPIKELGAKSTGKLSKIDRIKRLVPLFSQKKLIMPPVMNYVQLDGQTVDVMEAFMLEYQTFPFIPEAMHDDIMDCLARICDAELGVTFPDKDKLSNRGDHKRREERYYADPASYGFEPRADRPSRSRSAS